MPVGVHIVEKPSFTNYEIELKKGDCICAFSGGFVDQLDAIGRRKFMTRYFKKLLLDISQLPMTDQKEILNNKIIDWKGNYDQIDDILVMGMRV